MKRPEDGDACTVATSAVDAISLAPSQQPSVAASQQATSVLQNEYQRLLAEYDGICKEN